MGDQVWFAAGANSGNSRTAGGSTSISTSEGSALMYQSASSRSTPVSSTPVTDKASSVSSRLTVRPRSRLAPRSRSRCSTAVPMTSDRPVRA